MQNRSPALVIDATEWFVDEAWKAHVSARHWRRLPARADVAIRAVLAALPAEARATFFVPASLGERDPALLRELIAAGHEVAMSALAPVPLDQVEQGARTALLARWQQERQMLERAVGAAVEGFCACYTVGSGAAWWRDELPRIGFGYDATRRRGADDLVGDVEVQRVFAWRLDDGQPPLMGLPAAIRAAHERLVATGREALRTAVVSAAGTIARQLDLAPRAAREEGRAEPEATCRIARDVPPLTIVIPLMNEADGVRALFVELDALAVALGDLVQCQFVCVDDGSSDRTWELLQELAATRADVELIQHSRNRGVSAAIQTGIRASRSDLVASIDGDLSYDPMELRAMITLLRERDAAVVTASPYHARGGVQNVPGWRLFLSRTLSFAYRVLLWQPIHTWTACFRVYRRDHVVDLPVRHEGFLGTAELLVRVLRRGGTVVEHPCILEARLLGFSKMRVLRTVLGHLRLLAQVLLRQIR